MERQAHTEAGIGIATTAAARHQRRHRSRILLAAALCCLISPSCWSLDRTTIRERATELVAAKDLWGMVQLHQAADSAGHSFRSPYSDIQPLGRVLMSIPDWGRHVFERDEHIIMIGNNTLRIFDRQGVPVQPMVPLLHHGNQAAVNDAGDHVAGGRISMNHEEQRNYVHHALQTIPDGRKRATFEMMAEDYQRLHGDTVVANDGSAAVATIKDHRGWEHHLLVIYGPELDPIHYTGYRQPAGVGHKGQWLIALGADDRWHLLENGGSRILETHAAGPGCYVHKNDQGELELVDDRGRPRPLDVAGLHSPQATVTGSDGFLIITGTNVADQPEDASGADDLLSGLGGSDSEPNKESKRDITMILAWEDVLAGRTDLAHVIDGHWQVDHNHYRRLLRADGNTFQALDFGGSPSVSISTLLELPEAIVHHRRNAGHHIVVDASGLQVLLGPDGEERWRGKAQAIWRTGTRFLIVRHLEGDQWSHQLVALEPRTPAEDPPPPKPLDLPSQQFHIDVDLRERGILCTSHEDPSWIFLNMDGAVVSRSQVRPDGTMTPAPWIEGIQLYEDGWENRGGRLVRCDAGRGRWGWFGPSDVSIGSKGPVILTRGGAVYRSEQRGDEVTWLGQCEVINGQLIPDPRGRSILVADAERHAIASLDRSGEVDRHFAKPTEPLPEIQTGSATVDGHNVTLKTTGRLYWNWRTYQVPARRIRNYGRNDFFIVTLDAVLSMDARTFVDLLRP